MDKQQLITELQQLSESLSVAREMARDYAMMQDSQIGQIVEALESKVRNIQFQLFQSRKIK